MAECMILYPTETIYGIGVNALDEAAWYKLCELKGRDEFKVASWLVRTIDDIHKYAEVSEAAAKIAQRFLPGPLTLVLPAKSNVPESFKSEHGVSFRISSDPVAQALIARYTEKHDAPLTCTSANISGLEPAATPEEIIDQFKTHRPDFTGFDEVIDDGPRQGVSSTVVGVKGETVEVFREGTISESDLLNSLHNTF